MAQDGVLTFERSEKDGGRMTDRPAAFIVNSEAGTVRTRGAMLAKSAIEEFLPQWPQGSTVTLLKGAEIEETIAGLIASKRFGSVIIGGGDGTVSSTAGQLAGTGIALGIMPLGTMNFWRVAPGIDLELARAIEQLANGRDQGHRCRPGQRPGVPASCLDGTAAAHGKDPREARLLIALYENAGEPPRLHLGGVQSEEF